MRSIKLIPLTQGQYAIVNESDYKSLSIYKWYAHRNLRETHKNWKAQRCIFKNGMRKTVLMHRFILGIKNPKIQIDHENMDGLWNTRSNLRIASPQGNSSNRAKFYGKATSKFKGVCWYRRHKRWQSQILVNGKKMYLGFYKSEIEAAWAYDWAAQKFFGEFARLNFHE